MRCLGRHGKGGSVAERRSMVAWSVGGVGEEGATGGGREGFTLQELKSMRYGGMLHRGGRVQQQRG